MQQRLVHEQSVVESLCNLMENYQHGFFEKPVRAGDCKNLIYLSAQILDGDYHHQGPPATDNLTSSSLSVSKIEIRPWTHMMELPQLHGLGPAASRLLDSYQLLLQLLYNLKSLRESHVAVAMGTEGICEDDVASVTPEQALLGNLVTECEQALIVLNSGLSVLAASQARVLSEPSEVKALIYGKPSLSQRRTRAYKISFVHGPFPSGKRTLKRIRKPVKNLFNLVVCTCLKCAAKTLK